MIPELHIGPITLQTFGICFALGFIASGWLVGKRLKEIGKPVDWAYEIAFSALIGGIVGARGLYLIENPGELSGVFTGTGLVWYGGAIGGAIGVLIWAWRRRFLSLVMADLVAAPLALGYAVGRIGCQLSGDGDYGRPWDGPWAMSYPDGTVPTTENVHPTPVYETLTMVGVALLLWRLRDRMGRPGLLFALYLVLAGLERFLVEFVRRNPDVALELTEAQLFSLAMMIGGGIWLALPRGRAAGTATTT